MRAKQNAATFWLLLLGLLPCPVGGQTPAAVEGRLLKDLQLLTSDACEGRGITTKGIDLAADYIERQFVQAGLQPGGTDGTYFQRFTLTAEGTPGKRNTLVLQGPLGQTIALQAGKDYSVLLPGGSGKVEAALVFAGYGLSSTDPKYDDYAGLDVAGKVVIVLADTPRRGHPYADVFASKADPGINPGSLRLKAESARRHKAAGLLVVSTRHRAKLGDILPRPLLSMGDFAPWDLPMAHVPRDVVDAILFSASGETLKHVEEEIDRDLKPRGSSLSGWTCRLETEVSYKKIAVRNVVGVLEGSGPLAAETVVIGAHYDHVGQFGSTRRFPAAEKDVSGPGSIGGVGLPLGLLGEPAIHHGADDNASGTSALMEIARHFGAAKKREGRRLVFIAFTAEESGLLGSEYYCRNPLFPLADTVAMINMDQVGRLQEEKLLIGGLGSAKTFEPLLDKLKAKHPFTFSKEMSGFAPSDNASFYKRKIPALWFFTGFHEQYHRPTDRWETLNVPGLARIAALVGDVAGELAAAPGRPEYQKTANFDRTKTLWAMAPSIGLVPEYRAKEEGLLVEGVYKGTAAARAGLRKGDRIRAVGETKIGDAAAFHALARTLRPDNKVTLVVARDGKDIMLVLELSAVPAGFTDRLLGIVVNVGDLKNGLVLMDVVPDGPAAKAGLLKGDRIVALGGEPIQDRDTYFTLLRGFRPGETIHATVERGTMLLQVKITIEKAPAAGSPAGG